MILSEIRWVLEFRLGDTGQLSAADEAVNEPHYKILNFCEMNINLPYLFIVLFLVHSALPLVSVTDQEHDLWDVSCSHSSIQFFSTASCGFCFLFRHLINYLTGSG